MSAVTGVWAFILLDRTPEWLPVLRWIVLAGSIVVASVLVVGVHRLRRGAVVVAVAAALFGIAGAAAYAIDTAGHSHGGPIPTSGPATSGFGGEPGRGPASPGGPAGGGGPGAGSSDSPELDALVKSADNRWAAAGVGAMTTGGLELRTGASIMAIGGFTGSDNSPTLAQFQQYVADNQIGYFIAGGRGGPAGGKSGSAGEISTWVQQHFTPTVVGGTTVYGLRSAPHS
jgi:hypothetical protein